MQGSAQRIFDLIAQGVLQIEINQTYALEDVAQAHRDLESRATTGCSILLP
jgi:NADPH2:quinone reductase